MGALRKAEKVQYSEGMGRIPGHTARVRSPSVSLDSAQPLDLGQLVGLDSVKGGPGLPRWHHGMCGVQPFCGGSGGSPIRPRSGPHSAGLRDPGEGLGANGAPWEIRCREC